MKKSIALIAGGALLLLLPAEVPAQRRSGGPVPPDIVRAFAAAGLPVLRDRAAPADFSADLPDGTGRKLSDLRGKVVFLNFWASWCGPCRQEMPSMEALYQRFRDRGLEILGVNCREGAREAGAFMKANRLSFETALDSSGKISGSYGITAIPATFILDREGWIIARVVGSLNWSDPKIIAAFETLLKN